MIRIRGHRDGSDPIRNGFTERRNSTLQQLWNDYRGHKTLILLFEAPRKGEYWSRELILDFFPLKIYPPIVRVTSDRDDLMNHFKINR